MNDQQLLRYSRHIVLDGFDTVGQERLLNSHVLIVGMGGLGSPVATYLASAGIGQLTICDFDTVDLSNLQRQIIHRDSRLGQNKALSAKEEISLINRDCVVHTVTERLESDNLLKLVATADVVVDASDNFQTRHAVNRACIHYSKPLVSGTAINYVGQIAVFDLRDSESPCYACFVAENTASSDDHCSTSGVLAPLTGTVGSIQASEVIKLIALERKQTGCRALIYDAWDAEWCSIPILKKPTCGVCHFS
jgi:molybdopterin/thiamine biosynthesis adenylyltransferase